LVLLVALATWWYLRAESARRPETEFAAPTAPAELDESSRLAQVEPGARQSAPSDRDLGLVGGIAIPAGVRLSGVGRLEGRALERSSGAPLVGVRIDLLPLPPAGSQTIARLLRLANTGDDLAKRVEPIATTGTDITGAFYFEGVRPGQYFIEARGTRHVPDGVAHARVLGSGSGGPVDVWLRKGGRVLGRIENPDGSSAASAQVALTAGPTFAIEAARTGDIIYFEMRADKNGAFVFCGVPEGSDWQVTASGGDFALSHLANIAVQAGEDTQIVLRTQPGANLIGRVLSAAGAEGSSDSSTGQGLAGAHVGVVPRGLRDLSYAEEILRATHALTDLDGRYVMSHVPAGELDVLAIAPGHVPAKGPRVIVAVGGTQFAPDFELPRGPTVSGRVVDSAAAPIEGVVVRWNPVDLRNFSFDFSFAPLLTQAVGGFEFPKTDADGRFVAGAFPGEKPFRIEFSRLGFENQRVDWDPVSESELLVTLHAGGAVEGVVMDLSKSAPVTSFEITGNQRIDVDTGAPGRMNPFAGGQQVEDPRGKFRVESVAAGKRSLTFRAHGYLPTTVEDLEVLEGQTLRGVIVEMTPGGLVRGRVLSQTGAPVAGAQVFANAGTQFDPQTMRRNRPRGPLAARAGDPNIGRPEALPAGMSGMLAQMGMLGDRAVLSGADGSFELGGLELGSVTMYASHRDYVLGKSATFELTTEAQPAPVEIVLSAGSGIFGQATDRFGRPVPGAIVLALSPANLAGEGSSTGGGIYQGNTDAEGRYSIEHVSAGGYFVVLTRGDQALNPASFLGSLNFDLLTVPANERVQFDLVDSSAGACRVYGTVSAGSELLSGGSIAALGFESESLLGVDFKLAQIRDDGTYEFVGLAPGEYTLQITELQVGARPNQVRLEVEIPDAPEVRMDLSFPQGSIEGVVLARDGGEPLAGCELMLSRQDALAPASLFGRLLARDNGLARVRSATDGTFRLDRLQGGDYRLTVRPPRRGDGELHFAQPLPIDVELADGERHSNLRIELIPALAISGQVRRSNGEGLGGVEVIATSAELNGLLPMRARSDQ
jgi:hypothetical protein